MCKRCAGSADDGLHGSLDKSPESTKGNGQCGFDSSIESTLQPHSAGPDLLLDPLGSPSPSANKSMMNSVRVLDDFTPKRSPLDTIGEAAEQDGHELGEVSNDEFTTNILSAKLSITPQPQLLLDVENPFENEGCTFSDRTIFELASLQAARLIGVELACGKSAGEDEMDSPDGKKEDAESSEQGLVDTANTAEAIYNYITAYDAEETAPLTTANLSAKGRLTGPWQGDEELKSGGSHNIIGNVAEQNVAGEGETSDIGSKTIAASQKDGLYYGYQARKSQCARAGYVGRGMLAAVALALTVGLLWSKTP